MGKTKKRNMRSGVDKPYPNLADQIVGDRVASKKKEPKIRLRQDESEEVMTSENYTVLLYKCISFNLLFYNFITQVIGSQLSRRILDQVREQKQEITESGEFNDNI